MDLISAIDGSAPESAGAIDVLRRDHGRLRQLFQEYRRRMDEAPDTCRALAGEICMLWELHTRLEREFLYPALAWAEGTVEEALRAHEEIDECIATIRGWPPDSQRDSTMLTMMALADHHMAREEEILFPRAARVPAGELGELGREMLRRREDLAGSTSDLEGRS